jgi:hypothetical protein
MRKSLPESLRVDSTESHLQRPFCRERTEAYREQERTLGEAPMKWCAAWKSRIYNSI